MSNKQTSTVPLFFIGTGILIAGITMVLVWWPDVVALFRGVAGLVFGVVGLFILYNIKK